MRKYNLGFLDYTKSDGIAVARPVTSGKTIIYSGQKDLDHDNTQGVSLLMSKEATKALMARDARCRMTRNAS